MKVLVAYDGTLQSKDAVRYGIEKVKENGGELVAFHVFKSNMFVDYDVFGAEAAARKESAKFVAEAEQIIKEEGKDIWARVVVEEGEPEEEIIDFARKRGVDLLLCPPRYKAIIENIKKTLKEEGRDITESRILDTMEGVKAAASSARAR